MEEDNGIVNQVVQLGRMVLFTPSVDPGFGATLGVLPEFLGASSSKSYALPADFYRIWAMNFVPGMGSSPVHISPD